VRARESERDRAREPSEAAPTSSQDGEGVDRRARRRQKARRSRALTPSHLFQHALADEAGSASDEDIFACVGGTTRARHDHKRVARSSTGAPSCPIARGNSGGVPIRVTVAAVPMLGVTVAAHANAHETMHGRPFFTQTRAPAKLSLMDTIGARTALAGYLSSRDKDSRDNGGLQDLILTSSRSRAGSVVKRKRNDVISF